MAAAAFRAGWRIGPVAGGGGVVSLVTPIDEAVTRQGQCGNCGGWACGT